MDNSLFDDYFESSRLKNKRRKKRLVKGDFEKHLVQLAKRKHAIYLAIKELPLIELEEPYQKGWVRFFVVRKDVLHSAEAMFYVNVLEKINTFQFSNQKTFANRKKQSGKKTDHPREQFLAKISVSEWNANKPGLTDKEKSCFTRIEKWSDRWRCFKTYYEFTESWRFVFKIEPNIITHKKAVDAVLESENRRIENYIQNRYLGYKIYKTRNRDASYYYSLEKLKNSNQINHNNLNTIYEQYLEEKYT
ncbi:hypothetical protein [Flavobacterium sp. ENC]|uniref:hypothetical protein n=1 Tax=Flavobacterium sp. ENC TaxID=2897330 RepID=UPI001E5CF543|nr:hypothetical protein [Flavobacterium sp. ENC]MCD0467489.1 hypothetical protein [Flavobacterium sp. ENC]